MYDHLPQMRPLSTNVCPNAQPRAIGDFSACDQYALTTWGYCTECWSEDRVPSSWDRLVRSAFAANVP
jgi:hypothetical protein